MAGIGGIGGLGNFGGLGGLPGAAGLHGSAGLPGMGEAGEALGTGGGDESFADVLKDIVINRPSEAHAASSQLGMEAAAGGNVDTHQLAITSALAGVEIQMSTRVISSAVSGLRTLLQMQI